jgi:hypothetical protein
VLQLLSWRIVIILEVALRLLLRLKSSNFGLFLRVSLLWCSSARLKWEFWLDRPVPVQLVQANFVWFFNWRKKISHIPMSGDENFFAVWGLILTVSFLLKNWDTILSVFCCRRLFVFRVLFDIAECELPEVDATFYKVVMCRSGRERFPFSFWKARWLRGQKKSRWRWMAWWSWNASGISWGQSESAAEVVPDVTSEAWFWLLVHYII